MKIKNRIELGVNSAEQILKHNTYLLWFLILWLFRLPLEVAACIHWSQGYRTPSCLFFNMFLQITSWKSSVFTLITGVSQSFVFIFSMPLQICCCSCSIFTLVTGISHSFMFIFYMLLQMTLCGSNIFTLGTGISNAYLFNYNMFLQMTCCCSEKRICLDINASSEKFNSNYRKWISLKNFKI